MKVLVLAALKHEIKYILKELDARPCGEGTWLARQGKAEAAIFLTGMGVENAAARARAALLAHTPALVISAGFAGALYPGAEYGELVCPERAFLHQGASLHKRTRPQEDRAGLELAWPGFAGLFQTVSEKTGAKRGSIVTLSEWIEKPALKDFLPQPGPPYPVCDMETFPIAQSVLKSGAGFFALRSITDRENEEIGISPMEMADAGGQISTRLAAWRFICNPRLIPRAVKLRSNSEKAASALASALKWLFLSL